MSSETLKHIAKHLNKCPSDTDMTTIDFPFNVEEFCRENDEHLNKLKSLILLCDPVVSNVEMNELSAKQWSEYEKWKKENLSE